MHNNGINETEKTVMNKTAKIAMFSQFKWNPQGRKSYTKQQQVLWKGETRR